MELYIEDLMGSPPETIRPDTTVGQAVDRMRARSIHALPVVDDAGRAVGFAAMSDLIDVDDAGAPIASVMTSPVETIERYRTVRQAGERMLDKRIHHLVVVHEGRAVGVLSSLDLVRVLVEQRLQSEPAVGGDE